MIIRTKFLGPTNFKGSRLKATTPSGKHITISWDYALNIDGNHRAAARACIEAHGEADDHGTYSCIWDEGGGALFFPMAHRNTFEL